MDTVKFYRKCGTCAHHPTDGGLDSIPSVCWTCSSSETHGGPVLPNWKPIVIEQRPTPAGGVGDITSTERGSAARFNAGKPDYALIPLRVLAECMEPQDEVQGAICDALALVGDFQTSGDVKFLYLAIQALGPDALDEACHVLTYGKQKYAAWNWAKGFMWTVPLACIGRHAKKVLMLGEWNDDESGHTHRGHIAANIVMLLTFVRTYPIGNDLPPPDFFKIAE